MALRGMPCFSGGSAANAGELPNSRTAATIAKHAALDTSPPEQAALRAGAKKRSPGVCGILRGLMPLHAQLIKQEAQLVRGLRNAVVQRAADAVPRLHVGAEQDRVP